MDAPILRLDATDRGRRHRRAGSAARVTLEITRGRVQQRLRPVSGRVFLIGTASDCDLVLGDLNFPEVYAYLFVDGPTVTIRRLGGGPPLFVCGEPIDRGEVFQSDLVQFGPFALRIAIDAPAAGLESETEKNDEMLLEQHAAFTEDSALIRAVLPFSRHHHGSPFA